MRCLNCHTIVADSDPCCLSCGAQCTTPVRNQAGKPVPVIALVMLMVGMTCGYAQQGSASKLNLKDRAALRDRTTTANVWALAFFFVGLGGDALRWSLGRRQVKPSPAAPNLSTFSGPRIPSLAVSEKPGPESFGNDTRALAQPSPGYSGIVRLMFAGIWAVVFFFGAALIAAMIVVFITGNDPEQKDWVDEIVGTIMPYIFYGSIFLAGTLSILGKLPGTRSRTVPSGAGG